jgi:biopolymer transport protein ExbD
MRLLAVLFLILGLFTSGCDDDRKPVPQVFIRVLADGTFTLNHEPMRAEKLRSEIQRIADENRRSIGTTARVYVSIATQAGASQADKQMVVNTCVAAGINSIQQSSADE